MSLVSVEKKFDSYFSAVGHFLKELFGNASVEKTVNATLPLITNTILALIEVLTPGASPAVQAGIAQLQADYSSLCAIVQGAFPAPGSSATVILQQILASLSNNLNAILQDVGVKNSISFDKISAFAKFLLNEFSAILAEVSGTPAPPQPVLPQPPVPSASAPIPITGATVVDVSSSAPASNVSAPPTTALDSTTQQGQAEEVIPAPTPVKSPAAVTGGVQKMI